MQNLRDKLRKLAVLLAIFLPLFFAAAALGTKFGFWDWKTGLLTLTRQVGGKLMLFTFVVSAGALLLALFVKPRKGVLISFLAFCVPLAGIVHAKSVGKKAMALPFIHDITTDTKDVPSFSEAIQAMRKGLNTVEYTGQVDPISKKPLAQAQADGYPDIKPLHYGQSKDEVFAKALKAAQKMGWDIVTQNPETGIIEATDTTFWFGFKDDVVIRVRALEGGGSKVDIRSVSRVGKSDIGANAARIRKYIKVLDGLIGA